MTPPSVWRGIERVCGSLYRLVFIQNLLVHRAEKILPTKPPRFEGVDTSYLERTLDELFIDRMEGNEEIFSRVMTDKDFRSAAH